MTERSKDTTTLNTLIATLLDSVEGYQKSAEDTEDATLASRFRDRARERQSCVAELQAAVARLGGNPEDDSSTMGGLHRAFVDLKAAVTGRDDQAILNEVERGEDYLKGKFKTALEDVDLGPEARAAVDQAWSSVRAGHDEMSRLKHEWQGSGRGTRDVGEGETERGREQEYASEAGASSQAGSYSTAPGGAGDPSMTTTDTYQQSGGGYPGTISPNDGSGSTTGGGNLR